MHHCITTKFVVGMWMSILNNSRNVLTKGQEEGKKEEMDAAQVRWWI